MRCASLGLLDEHARNCVMDAEGTERTDKTDELMAAAGRLMRRGWYCLVRPRRRFARGRYRLTMLQRPSVRSSGHAQLPATAAVAAHLDLVGV